MRMFEDHQLRVGEVSVEKIKIDVKSRDDIPKILLGLQAIYTDDETKNKLFNIFEKIKTKKGRKGMHFWNIFVLAMIKLNLNCDYDRLHELANHHDIIRQMLGVSPFNELKFTLKTIKNNVMLLTPELLEEINKIVVDFGHKLMPKKKTLMQDATLL